MVSVGEIAFWSLEGGDTLSRPEGNDVFGTHDTCVTKSEQRGMFHQVFPLIHFVLSHTHSCGKRKQLNPLAELL